MSHLLKSNIINAFDEENLIRVKDLLEGYRRQIEEDNESQYWEDVTVTTPSGINTEFLVECLDLNRTPVSYVIIKKNKAVDIYTSDTIWTKNKLYLKATVASATIIIRVVG